MVYAARRQVRVGARTTTGTQQITISGIGTPKAVTCDILLARIDNVNANGAEWSTGMYDGTRVRSAGIVSFDNQASSLTYRAGSTDTFAFLINSGGTDGALKATVTFITDGIELNWTAVDGLSRYLVIDFYIGDDLQAYVGGFDMSDNAGNPNQTLDVTAPNFQPDFIRTIMGPTFGSGVAPSSSVFFCHGMGVRTSGGVAQVAMSWSHTTGLADARPSLSTSESHIARLVRDANATPLTTLHAVQLDSMLSTGFRVKDTLGSNPPEVGYLAVRWGPSGGGRLVYLDKITSPTSASGTVVIDNNTRVQSALIFSTIADATGDKVDGQGGNIGIGYAERNTPAAEAWSHWELDNAAATDSGTFARTGYAIEIRDNTGAAGIEATATYGDDNFTLTFPTVMGTGRLHWVATFEEIVEGNALVTLPAIQSAITAREVFRGPIAVTLPAIQSSAGGSVDGSISGSASVTLPAIQSSVTAVQKLIGSAAVTLPAIQSALTAREVFRGTASATLPAIQSAATGREVFRGTAAATLPAIQMAAEASTFYIHIATASVTLPKIIAAATGREVFRGTAAATLPAIQSSATAVQKLIGSAAVTLPAIQSALTAREVFVGSAAATLPAIQSSATAVQKLVASAAVTLPAIASSATATTGFVGSAAVTLPAISAAATAVQKLIGSASVTLPAIQSAATAREVFTSSAAVTLPAIQSAATALTGFVGSASVTLPSISAAATAREVFVATAAVTLPAISADADGNTLTTTVSGAIAVTLPSISASSSAREVFVGMASTTLAAIQSAATAREVFVCQVAAGLPAIACAASGAEVFRASGVVTLPALSAAAAALVVLRGSIAVTLPAIVAHADDGTRIVPTQNLTGSSVLSAAMEGSYLSRVTMEGSLD